MPELKSKWLLTQNRELRDLDVYNWTLPAYKVRLSDGSWFNTCPNAGVCAGVCYARQGAYLFPSVKEAHLAKLEMVLFDTEAWIDRMCRELKHKRYHGRWIRIHDAGDFFSDDYLASWLHIIYDNPQCNFYAYTREVSRFKRVLGSNCPSNFKFLFSYGGKEDDLIDPDVDRHCDVFPDPEAMEAAGYFNQEEDDRLAVTAPTNKIGVLYNKIPTFIKKLAGRTFREYQQEYNQRSIKE